MTAPAQHLLSEQKGTLESGLQVVVTRLRCWGGCRRPRRLHGTAHGRAAARWQHSRCALGRRLDRASERGRAPAEKANTQVLAPSISSEQQPLPTAGMAWHDMHGLAAAKSAAWASWLTAGCQQAQLEQVPILIESRQHDHLN